MAYITFTDGAGAAQLDNGLRSIAGGVGARFKDWKPETKSIGVMKTALGTGQRVMFPFRTDYVATLSLIEIPQASLTIINRLKAWLELGNTCAVYTEDSVAASYATCGLAEGGTFAAERMNDKDLVWKVTMTLVNLAASPVPMSCIYSA